MVIFQTYLDLVDHIRYIVFAIKTLMVSQFGDLKEPNMHHTPILATFSNISGRPKDMGKTLIGLLSRTSYFKGILMIGFPILLEHWLGCDI